ncbi:MAG: hypothetical protein KAT16_05950 [Candidatus Heimdallarchaeota archaeon]|nr:hypothetical protein [Candidatus Heimdallarchaeota archaeon]
MSKMMLTAKTAINRGLLSALLPMTFIKDFRVYASGLIFSFTEDIENILPQVETFLDTLNEITDTQFYFEVVSKRIGILKIFDAEKVTFNDELLFQE